MTSHQTLTPELLLEAYRHGLFPMAESRDTPELHWFSPEERGIIPLDHFHIPRSLRKFMRDTPYALRVDTAFADVIRACATTPRSHEQGTWINPTIETLYTELWKHGHAHSVECWRDDTLVGGLYGVSIGGAFFGESMFSHAPNASKVALVMLVRILNEAGFTLLDTQYVNDHLLQFGIEEIPRNDYLLLLEQALRVKTDFTAAAVRVTDSPAPSGHTPDAQALK